MPLDRRTLDRLPIALDAWEVDLVEVPIAVEGFELEGILVVVEVGTGVARAVGLLTPGAELDEHVAGAIAHPRSGASPARPRRILCRTESLRARLSTLLHKVGTEVRRVDALPAVDAVVADLLHDLGAVAEAVRAEEATPPQPPIAARFPHMLLLTAFGTVSEVSRTLAIVVKLAKRDAERLASDVASVDRIRFEAGDGSVTLYLGDGSGERVLQRLPDRGDDLLARMRAAPHLVLVVSAGGTKRRSLDPREFVLTRNLQVVGPARADAAPSTRHARTYDPVFDGPVDRWPKASERLLAFADVLLVEPRPTVALLERTLSFAQTVWNAVVLEDHGQDGRFLADVRRSTSADPGVSLLLERLVDRKRAHFGDDPRLFEVTGIDLRDGVPYVRVGVRLPPGLRTR